MKAARVHKASHHPICRVNGSFASKWHVMLFNMLVLHTNASNGVSLLVFCTKVREEYRSIL